jgi:hypothetical protein
MRLMKLSPTMKLVLMGIANGTYSGINDRTMGALNRRGLVEYITLDVPLVGVAGEYKRRKLQPTIAGWCAILSLAQAKFDTVATYRPKRENDVTRLFRIASMQKYGALIARAEWHTS